MNADRFEEDLYFEDGEDLDFLVSEQQKYFRQLEEYFLDRRGSPLTFNELESELAETWFEEGVPI